MQQTAIGAITNPVALLIIAIGLAVAFPVGSYVSARYHRSRWAATLLVAATGSILSVTLSPDREAAPYDGSGQFQWQMLDQVLSPGAWWHSISTLGSSVEEVANILLFIPFGFLGYIVWRRILPMVAFGILFSLAIEIVQSATGWRSGDLSDVVSNGVGLLLGITAGVGYRIVSDKGSRGHAEDTTAGMPASIK